MIGFIWQARHLNYSVRELAIDHAVQQLPKCYEYQLEIFCSNAEDLVKRLKAHADIFRQDRQVEITLMPCFADGRIDVIGHMINVEKTATSFLLENSRNKQPFQRFLRKDYAWFLTSIFAAGSYQLLNKKGGLCLIINVEQPLTLTRKEQKTSAPKLDISSYNYPSAKKIWPDYQSLSEQHKNILIFAAAHNNNVPTLDFWLANIKELQLYRNYFNSYNALHFSVQHNHPAIFKRLVHTIKTCLSTKPAKDQDLLKTLTSLQGSTSLLVLACDSNRLTMVQELLALGYDPQEKDPWDISHFMRAAVEGHIDLLRILFKAAPANIHTITASNGFTTLHWVVCQKYPLPQHPEIIKELLAMGVDPLTANCAGMLPFTMAAGLGNIKMLKAMLDGVSSTTHKAMIDHRDNNGFTALFYTATVNDDETFSFLLKAGVDTSLTYRVKESPKELNLLEITQLFSLPKLAKLLIEHRSSPVVTATAPTLISEAKLIKNPPHHSFFTPSTQPIKSQDSTRSATVSQTPSSI